MTKDRNEGERGKRVVRENERRKRKESSERD